TGMPKRGGPRNLDHFHFHGNSKTLWDGEPLSALMGSGVGGNLEPKDGGAQPTTRSNQRHRLVLELTQGRSRTSYQTLIPWPRRRKVVGDTHRSARRCAHAGPSPRYRKG